MIIKLLLLKFGLIMDEFWVKLNRDLELKTRRLGRFIEKPHKELISKCYKCMSDCYFMPYSLEQCGYCEEKCQISIKRAHKELQNLVDGLHEDYDNCNKSCDNVYRKNEEYLKKCLRRCVEDISIRITDSKSLAEKIISRYSN